MSNSTFDFNTCFNQAWKTYKKHLLLLVGASLVSSLLISVSFGILTGPIMAGLITLILKLMDEDSSAGFEDIFSQFSTFATTFLLCLAWGAALYMAMMVLMIMPLIGQLAAVLISIGFSVFITFAVMLAAEKGMDFGQASRAALEMLKKDLWPLIGFAALASILSGVGAIACGIGVIFTMPMFYIMLAVAYRACSADTPAEAVLVEEPTVPEPPSVPAEPVAETPAEEPPPSEEPRPIEEEPVEPNSLRL